MSDSSKKIPTRLPSVEAEPTSRLKVVLRIEWTLLVCRYLLYVAVVVLHLSGSDSFLVPYLVVAASSALLHNAFAHWALHTRHYNWFLSPFNFALYVGRAAFLIWVTGGETSPLAPLFLIILIGFHLYAPGSPVTVWVTLVLCACYSFIILGGWLVRGVNLAYLPVYANLTLLVCCGWLMSLLSRLMRQLEDDGVRRARALQSSEATLRTILDNAAEPILVFGESEFIAEANNPACEFLGVSREKLAGRRFREFLFDDGLLAERVETMRRGGAYRDEMLMIKTDGEERSVDMHVHSFIRDQRLFFVAMFRDITEQKDLQETQRQAKHQLELVNAELQRVYALRTEFYTNIARRLRSPLTALLGFVEMMLDEEMGDINGEQRNSLQSCRRSAGRMLDLVDEAFHAEFGRAPLNAKQEEPPEEVG